MTDQELLELAANAAGMGDLENDISGFYRVIGEHEDGQKCMVEWNPNMLKFCSNTKATHVLPHAAQLFVRPQ